MKTSLIITVLHEENTIQDFLDSVLNQSEFPDELIIVDGGSTDTTLLLIAKKRSQFAQKKIELKVITKVGNRSVGRNEAINHASGDIILISDAGCVLDTQWVKTIREPFADKKIDVVAGYYQGRAKTIFEKCLIPYVLVMPDHINEKTFLPATRSMALRKNVWKKIGGFPEAYAHNEDYVFANTIKRKNISCFFARKAIVYWMPRSTPKDAYVMFFRFALGDGEARLFRKKVIALFMRYGSGIVLLMLYITTTSVQFGIVFLVLLCSYVLWAIEKNYKYVRDLRGVVILPFLQILSDVAVISGTITGTIHSWHIQNK